MIDSPIEKPIDPLFTDKDLRIVEDSDFLLAKRRIVEHVVESFAALKKALKIIIQEGEYLFPPEIPVNGGKISRGDNYQGLPYVVLDYPAVFSRSQIFAYRSMFLWGDCFSFTWHFSGDGINIVRKRLIANADQLVDASIFICINSDPWQHHYQEDNYVLFTSDLFPILQNHSFIKLSQKIPLRDFSQLNTTSVHHFKFIADILR